MNEPIWAVTIVLGVISLFCSHYLTFWGTNTRFGKYSYILGCVFSVLTVISLIVNAGIAYQSLYWQVIEFLTFWSAT